VVVWRGGDPPTTIRAQRFSAAGFPIGGEFQVNTYTRVPQQYPSVASAPDGRFVVTWYGGPDVYAQRFDASGAPQGPELRVNSPPMVWPGPPTVAMDRNGNFVVAWVGPSRSQGDDIFVRRFNASGAPQGPEFLVNSYTTGLQNHPAVAADADGNFVVVWTDHNEYEDGYGLRADIFARRYDAAGFPLAGQFQVNGHTPYRQGHPEVAAAADGRFSVAWRSRQDGHRYGIVGQLYDAAGVAQGGEFQANTYTFGDQEVPALASNPDGDLVVVWQSQYQDGYGGGPWGIYAQRFGDLIFQDGFETGDTGNRSSVRRGRYCR
jgi:hypothetical protein